MAYAKLFLVHSMDKPKSHMFFWESVRMQAIWYPVNNYFIPNKTLLTDMN